MSTTSNTPDAEDQETQEILSATNKSLNRSSSHILSTVKDLQAIQSAKTNTLLKKLCEFFKIAILRRQNTFENYILTTESSDCSLVAKYSKISKIDLSNKYNISVNEMYLNTLHIPHPLFPFTQNTSNDQPIEKITKLSQDLNVLPVCLLIHGLGGQMSQFESLFALISQCSEIFSLDLPGFGSSRSCAAPGETIQNFGNGEFDKMTRNLSTLNWDDLGTDNIVDIVFAFIEQYIPSDRKIILVGHSMGTHLSIKLLNKLQKDRVESIILLSPPKFIENHNETETETSLITKTNQRPTTTNLLYFFTWFPWLFNFFRIYDRLNGLDSKSVSRQLDENSNISNKVRQLRWNLDINSKIILKYVFGFKQATTSELISGVSKINNIKNNKLTKILIIHGDNDKVTPIINSEKTGKLLDSLEINNKFLKIFNCGHSLLLDKPEIICGLILNFTENLKINLSPSWVLIIKSKLSGDKWGLKNELKWCKVQPISTNLINPRTHAISNLLAMKTLRENDEIHSPRKLEILFEKSTDENYKNLIAIIDISADLPPYNPNSFDHIKYHKLPTVSKIEPDSIMIRKFITLIDDILSKYSQNISNREFDEKLGLPLIGVHCHYGFNRTGFLICCYLIERLGWSVNEAINSFKIAREPGIKHPHFIDALYVRYER